MAALPPTRAVWKLSSHRPMSSAEMKSELDPCAANWLTTWWNLFVPSGA